MADVTDRFDRGQLILITGLVVALLLVVLVVLLNAVIYTENIGTREVDGDSREPIGFQNEVIEVTGSMIDAENEAEHDDEEFDEVRDQVLDGVVRSNELLSQQYAETGVVAEINTTDDALEDAAIEGHMIRQNESRTFESPVPGDPESWRVAEDINDSSIRQYEMTVDGGLTGADPSDPAADGAFYIEIDDGTDNWRLYAFQDNGDPTLAVANGSEPVDDPTILNCGDGELPVELDLTAGEVDGDACSKLTWANELDEEYDVYYRNADNAEGTFNTTIKGEDSPIDHPSPNQAEQPYEVPAVYGMELNVSFYTADITYEATVRVAPGEPA